MFDPLSFFTPVAGDISITDHEYTLPDSSSSRESGLKDVKQQEQSHDDNDEMSEDDDDDEYGELHILDFPVLNAKLPRGVTLILLQLLKPDQETNFNKVIVKRTKDQLLADKNIESDEFDKAQLWLSNNGYNKLSHTLLSLHFTPDLFSYLNKLCVYYQTDDEILQLASLRISENCGRTARPEFQRQIVIKGLKQSIMLNEPSLTSDSLGLKTWGSSLILSEFIAQHPNLIKEPVLELGAGTGLVGITIALLGFKVTLTDLPEILPNLVKNADLNNINDDDCECAVLDWTDPTEFLETHETKYQTIVVADPIYSPDHPKWVVDMLRLFLGRNKDAKVLLQLPIRQNFDKERQDLWRLCEETFEVIDEVLSDGFDDFGAQKFIYKQLRWKE